MSGLIHYKYIDALRGWAFLGVLTVHASQEVRSLPGGSIAAGGMFGVQLFFLLSAVTLLRSVSLRTAQEQFPIRNFFIRRFFRIAPLFWAGIALYFLLEGCGPRTFAPNGVGFWHFLSTALFLHGWTPTTITSVVPGGWSIAVEMTFYLCLPFLARRISSLWPAVALTFCSIIVSVALAKLLHAPITRAVPQNEQYLVLPFLFYWFPSQLPVFLIGFIVYYCLQSETVTRFLAVPQRPAWLALISVFGFIGLTQLNLSVTVIHICYAAIFAILIVSLAARPFAVAVNRATCHVGVLSFSCYVTHFAVLKVTARFIRDEDFSLLPARLIPVCHFVGLWTAALVMTIMASTLTYVLIEKPGIRLGNILIRRSEETGSILESPQIGST